jgi:hypothetical protein
VTGAGAGQGRQPGAGSSGPLRIDDAQRRDLQQRLFNRARVSQSSGRTIDVAPGASTGSVKTIKMPGSKGIDTGTGAGTGTGTGTGTGIGAGPVAGGNDLPGSGPRPDGLFAPLTPITPDTPGRGPVVREPGSAAGGGAVSLSATPDLGPGSGSGSGPGSPLPAGPGDLGVPPVAGGGVLRPGATDFGASPAGFIDDGGVVDGGSPGPYHDGYHHDYDDHYYDHHWYWTFGWHSWCYYGYGSPWWWWRPAWFGWYRPYWYSSYPYYQPLYVDYYEAPRQPTSEIVNVTQVIEPAYPTYDQAWDLMAEGLYEDAREAFARLIEKNQWDGLTRAGHGLSAAALGDDATAIYDMRSAFRDEPDVMRYVPVDDRTGQLILDLAGLYRDRARENQQDVDGLFMVAALGYIITDHGMAYFAIEQAIERGDTARSTTNLRQLLAGALTEQLWEDESD